MEVMCELRNAEMQLLLKEAGLLDKTEKHYYIYGAADNAKSFLELFKTLGVASKIKGFLVTDMKGNPETLEGLPVFDVHKFKDKDVCVLVPHAGVYKREIFSLLQELQFENIYSLLNFKHLMSEKEKKAVNDSYMEEAKRWIKEQNTAQTKAELDRNKKIEEEIRKIQKEGNPDFGGVEFYQGFEQIGIQGKRPTQYRILKYGLKDILKKNQDVLDIGCNSGFLDMAVSDMAASITGVEYDASLVAVAQYVKEALEIKNCTFIQGDFNDWYKEQTKKYDVIFSFAIHHWLNLKAEEYVERVDTLLKSKGFICLESHDLTHTRDKVYEECLAELSARGYAVLKREDIMDDGCIRRNFVILQKKR